MKLPNPINSTTRQAVISHLRGKRQMKQIGRGMFARVYGRTKLNRIVKVGDGSDKYLNYVSIIGLRNRNPYFPTLYSIKRYEDSWKHFYVIEMEKLTKWSKVPKSIRNRLLNKLGCRDIWAADCPRMLHSSSRWEKEAIKSLRKLWSSHCVAKDVHQYNIMFRRVGKGWQLVYTDPVA